MVGACHRIDPRASGPAAPGGEMSIFKTVLGVIRPPFLLLTPAVLLPVFVLAWQAGARELFPYVLVLLGATAAHAAVNALNEYQDFRSGLDLITVRTPYSGGSGTLVAAPDQAGVALAVALFGLMLAIGIGIYFIVMRGAALVPIGVVGIAIIVSYTRFINRMPLLCLIAPGLGFGPLMAMGACYALTGRIEPSVFVISLPALFLVSGLLLLNQFPDVEADARHGRVHYPILLGRAHAAWLFVCMIALAYVVPVMLADWAQLAVASLWGLATIPLAVNVCMGVVRQSISIPALLSYMGRNVVLVLSTPVLMAAGLVWRGYDTAAMFNG